MALGISWANIPNAFRHISELSDLPIRSTYDMLFNNKSIDQVVKAVTDEAAESFDPYTGGDDFDLDFFGEDGIEDIHAVDKALYQRDNPSALLTPWGPALDLDGIDAIIDQNPGVDPLVGIGGEERVELMGEADDLMNQFPEFMGELWEDAEAAGMAEGTDPLDAAKNIIEPAIDAADQDMQDADIMGALGMGLGETSPGEYDPLVELDNTVNDYRSVLGLQLDESAFYQGDQQDPRFISDYVPPESTTTLQPPLQMGGYGAQAVEDLVGNLVGGIKGLFDEDDEEELVREEGASLWDWAREQAVEHSIMDSLIRPDPDQDYLATDEDIIDLLREHLDRGSVTRQGLDTWLEGKGWLDEEHPEYLRGRMMLQTAVATVGDMPGAMPVGEPAKESTLADLEEADAAGKVAVPDMLANIFYEYLDQTKDQFGTPLGARQDVYNVSEAMFLESEALFWLHGINNPDVIYAMSASFDPKANGARTLPPLTLPELYTAFLEEYMDEVLRGVDHGVTSGVGFDNAIRAVRGDMTVPGSYGSLIFGADDAAWKRSVILMKVYQKGRSYGPKGRQEWIDEEVNRSKRRGEGIEGLVEIFKTWTPHKIVPRGLEPRGRGGPMDIDWETPTDLESRDRDVVVAGAVDGRQAVPLPPARPTRTAPTPGVIPAGAFRGPGFYGAGRAFGRPRVAFPTPVPAQPLRPLRTFPSPGLIPRGAFRGPEFYGSPIPSDPMLPIAEIPPEARIVGYPYAEYL